MMNPMMPMQEGKRTENFSDSTEYAEPEPEPVQEEEPAIDDANIEAPTALVPTALRVKRTDAPKQKPKPAAPAAKPKGENKDQAYDQFLQDMKELGAV
jgi:hypothetical protein